MVKEVWRSSLVQNRRSQGTRPDKLWRMSLIATSAGNAQSTVSAASRKASRTVAGILIDSSASASLRFIVGPPPDRISEVLRIDRPISSVPPWGLHEPGNLRHSCCQSPTKQPVQQVA